MTEAEFKRIINAGHRKLSDIELKKAIDVLKRLAEIEFNNYNRIKNEKGNPEDDTKVS